MQQAAAGSGCPATRQPVRWSKEGAQRFGWTGAAVANTIFNATGVRIRDYPLMLDKVPEGMAGRSAAAMLSPHRRA